MSWEGYYQVLCANGHPSSTYPHDGDEACRCGAPIVWTHTVDLTNGCECGDSLDVPVNGCPAHPLPLDVKEKAVTKECPTCHHVEVVKEATYKIPEGH